MTMNIWIRRSALLMCVLVLFMCLVPGFQQPARALALVDDVAIFLLGFLAISGIILVSSTFNLPSAISHVTSAFESFIDSLGESLDSVLSDFSLSMVGSLLCGNSSLSNYAEDFASWYVSEYNLSDSTYTGLEIIPDMVQGYLSYDFIEITNNTHYFWISSSSSPVYVLPFAVSARKTYYIALSDEWFDGYSNSNHPENSFSANQSENGVWYTSYIVSAIPPSGYSFNPASSEFRAADFVPSLTYPLSFVEGNTLTAATSVIDIPSLPSVDDVFGLAIPGIVSGDSVDDALDAVGDAFVSGTLDNLSVDTVTLPEPSVVSIDPTTLPLPVVVQGTVTTVIGGGSIRINNGEQDAIPVYLPGGITVSWPLDGVPINWPSDGIPIDWSDVPSITMDLPATFFDDLTDAISDALDDSLADYGPASQYRTPGLTDVFPFCIPFDIYHFFEALAADPVAPSFEIPFVVDGLVDYTFEIDLSDFESVAQVVRTMELLLFCVGLALVTRNLIRG